MQLNNLKRQLLQLARGTGRQRKMAWCMWIFPDVILAKKDLRQKKFRHSESKDNLEFKDNLVSTAVHTLFSTSILLKLLIQVQNILLLIKAFTEHYIRLWHFGRMLLHAVLRRNNRLVIAKRTPNIDGRRGGGEGGIPPPLKGENPPPPDQPT